MSDYAMVTAEEVNRLILKHEMDLTMASTHDEPVAVLYRIIERQAEQLAELKTDVERLAMLSGFDL